MSFPLNIALAQINPTVGDLDNNAALILDYWSRADDTMDLVTFPELALCGYPPEDLILKPSFIQACKTTLEAILIKSAHFKSAALIGCPWEIGGRLNNALHLVEHGGIISTITKHHLPNYGVFDEKRVFVSGNIPDPVKFRGHSLGIMICEDMWFKNVAQHLKNEGAEILICANASPYTLSKHKMRVVRARERTQETNLPLLYVNQVGGQDELVFDGASFVMSANGQLIMQAPPFVESVYNANDTDIAPTHDIQTLYNALVTGLRDYIKKNNFPGVLLGLSGGIDSALSAVIAVDAIGADRVHCVMMPSKHTSQDSLDDVQALSDNLNVKLDNISIETPVTVFNDLLTSYINNNAPSTTFENIQPRTRGLILMALSNANGKMVLSTGNKSEMAVGYATLYGDMCGGFNILKDVYKMQVYALSEWVNKRDRKNTIPQRIITKAPTAELKDDQTDQDTLPPYKELDAILHGLIEDDKSIDDLAQDGFDSATVTRVWKMLDRAEYKRRQSAPGVKITTKAFGRDRRYPITNGFTNLVEKHSS